MKTEYTREDLLQCWNGKARCVLCCGQDTHEAECPLANPKVTRLTLTAVMESDVILESGICHEACPVPSYRCPAAIEAGEDPGVWKDDNWLRRNCSRYAHFVVD